MGPQPQTKKIWDDLFYDMDNCGIDRSAFALKAGAEFKDTLRSIEDAIKAHEPKKALQIIAQAKSYF
jgi:hypothetical protein